MRSRLRAAYGSLRLSKSTSNTVAAHALSCPAHAIVHAPLTGRPPGLAGFTRLAVSGLGKNQRRTVTLTLPTLPLLSKARKEIVCSPGESPARLIE